MAKNLCKNCVRQTECKTRKGSHQYCFEPINKPDIQEDYYSVKNKKLLEICQRCGRKLKTEESIKNGYGPTCYKKVFRAKKGYAIPLFTVLKEGDLKV